MIQTEEQFSPAAMTDPHATTWRHYLELTKPRLSMLSVTTAMVGYLAAVPYFEWTRTLLVVLGTGLCAGGVAAFSRCGAGSTD